MGFAWLREGGVGLELDARRRALLIGSLIAVTLHAFDELAVVTALPVIVADLGQRALYGTVFFAYLLSSLIGLVGAGWLATRYGPGRPLAWGLAAFAAGLVVAALAPSMGVVVAGRTLQGLGGGTLGTVVLVIVSREFEPSERPQVMAINSAAWVVPALIAPAVAGTVAESFGWRWVFAGLLPLVAAAGALALPALRGMAGTAPEQPLRVVIADATRLALGLGVTLAALARPLSIPSVAAIAAGGAVALHAMRRILPAGYWRARPIVPAAVAGKLLLGFAFFGTEAFVPLALADVHGTSATYAGLALTTAALSWTAAAFLQARLAVRHSSRLLAGAGSGVVLMGIGAVALVLLESTPPALTFAAWCVAGAGMGLAYNTLNTTAMAHSPDGREGPLSTALGVGDAVGISLGTGVGGALVSLGDRSGWHTAESLGAAWLAMGLVAVLAAVSALRLGSSVIAGSQPAANPDVAPKPVTAAS